MVSAKAAPARLHHWLNGFWYGHSRWPLCLLPLSLVFYLVSVIRKGIYRYLPAMRVTYSAPVIVVGNITVGGCGKTPMVIELANRLSAKGYRVGIASRGYGRKDKQIRQVHDQSSARQVGDEPLLIYRNTGAAVLVGANRKKIIAGLIEEFNCKLIICDDGLQDYRFKHTLEINMIDAERVFGNGYLLPAGPLREHARRLTSIDFNVAATTAPADMSADCLVLSVVECVNVHDPSQRRRLRDWQGNTVHAVAGIAHPERFFAMLEACGLKIIRHAQPDHAGYAGKDFEFNDDLAILITEKDAVKCAGMEHQQIWYVPLVAQLPKDFVTRVESKLRENYGSKIT